MGDVMNPVAIPNKEADFNNNGAFSTDYIGHKFCKPGQFLIGRALFVKVCWSKSTTTVSVARVNASVAGHFVVLRFYV